MNNNLSKEVGWVYMLNRDLQEEATSGIYTINVYS